MSFAHTDQAWGVTSKWRRGKRQSNHGLTAKPCQPEKRAEMRNPASQAALPADFARTEIVVCHMDALGGSATATTAPARPQPPFIEVWGAARTIAVCPPILPDPESCGRPGSCRNQLFAGLRLIAGEWAQNLRTQDLRRRWEDFRVRPQSRVLDPHRYSRHRSLEGVMKENFA